jgi:hypothetical protein
MLGQIHKETSVKINMAHLRERAATGGYIDFAVFDARSGSGTDAGNAALLRELTGAARMQGLKVDQSALAFTKNGKIVFYGSPNLVKYLSKGWVPKWTHAINR